jgi:hypothetical protein
MLPSDEEPAPAKWQEPACSGALEQHLKGGFRKADHFRRRRPTQSKS